MDLSLVIIYSFLLSLYLHSCFLYLTVKCLIFHLRRRMSEWIGVDGKCEWGARVIFLTLRMALEKLFRQISELCDLWGWTISPLHLHTWQKNLFWGRFKMRNFRKSFCLCSCKLIRLSTSSMWRCIWGKEVKHNFRWHNLVLVTTYQISAWINTGVKHSRH